MIELVSELLEESIKFQEDKINILEINSKALYKEFVYRINRKINFDESYEDMSLYEGLDEISLPKNALLVHDMYNIFSSQTKLLKTFYKDTVQEYKLTYDDGEINRMQSALIRSIKDVLNEYNYEISCKTEIDISDLLKCLNVKFDEEYYNNPYNNIILLIDLISRFNLCKILILVNVKCYFVSDELEEIYKMILHLKVKVLFIEFYKDNDHKKYENKVIVDEDFDEIYIN